MSQSKNQRNATPMFESLEQRSLMSVSVPGPRSLELENTLVSNYSAPSKPGATELSATRSPDAQTQGIIAVLIGL